MASSIIYQCGDTVVIVSVSKPEQVRQVILFQILSGDLRPGQRLLEAKLAAELGVSQATVNGALQDLHNQGLVVKLLNRSTKVRHYPRCEIEQIFAVRIVLEPAATAAAAAAWSEEGRNRLREQVDNMRRAARSKTLPKFWLADYTFHQEVYRLTQNSFFIQACQAIAAAPLATVLSDRLQSVPVDYLDVAEDHQDLIRAMEEGPEAAARLARAQIEQSLQSALRALESEARQDVVGQAILLPRD